MEPSQALEPLIAPILAVQRLIEEFDDRGIIIGGIAASLLGQPRLTADAEAMLLPSLDELPRLLEAAPATGLSPRYADVEEFARRNRVVLLRHDASGIDVDISLGLLPFEVEAVERSHEYQAGKLRIRLPTPEDLIILKAAAHRPKDMLDIAAVIVAQADLDTARIGSWVRQPESPKQVPPVAWLLDSSLRSLDLGRYSLHDVDLCLSEGEDL